MEIVILSGAGISAESGIQTFRGAGGLWEGYDVMQVASIEGWHRNPELVLDFYNHRRRQLKSVKPNDAHLICAELQNYADVKVVTQNVDDLHERAGSKNVLHLHGELKKARSEKDENYIIDIEGDINWGDSCPRGGQLRPHIVWFGELVPMMESAEKLVKSADVVIVIGTSLQVYPAAGLVLQSAPHSQIWYIDPKPTNELNKYFGSRLTVLKESASSGMKKVLSEFKN
ncbi:MAG: NAD-dependent deacylase [Saprospirales bacterium]|nr:MAG: NAD-dependent deacylase [Saprospirales bacterium]